MRLWWVPETRLSLLPMYTNLADLELGIFIVLVHKNANTFKVNRTKYLAAGGIIIVMNCRLFKW